MRECCEMGRWGEEKNPEYQLTPKPQEKVK